MTNQQILEKAIQKAIDGGWKPATPHLDGFNAEFMAMTINDTAELYSVIFSHYFAKALWGDSDDDRKVIVGETDWHKWPLQWQYHLQMMVISDNPIEYLGQNI